MVRIAAATALAFAYVLGVFAHPGEKSDPDQFRRDALAAEHWAIVARESLKKCSGTEAARSLEKRSIERRVETVRSLRDQNGIVSATRKLRRDAADLAKWEAIDHNQTGIYEYTAHTSEKKVFKGITSAILAPIVTDGPYYIWGEMIRKDVVEKRYSKGVPLHLEVQYYNVETCEPVPNVYVDIWNANATGVYSGIAVSGNEAADGYNSTYLRGIQVSDNDGVVTFNTIFPGHYEGRATHTHLLAHTNVTVLANNTLLVGTGAVSHIGQLFWNEVLRTAVEETLPYSTNTQPVTSNADDMWSVLQASASYDPFPEFLYLGETIDDGLFAWKQIGLNMPANYTANSYYQIAGYLQADGGHVNTAGGGGGAGAAPTGNPPTGSPPASTTATS